MSLSAKAGKPDPRTFTPGHGDLLSLSNLSGLTNGITEEGSYSEDPSTYTLRERTEENRLFEVNHTVRDLIKNLESKKSVITEQKNED